MDYRTRLLMVVAVSGLCLSQDVEEFTCEKGEKLTKFSTKMDKDKRTFEFDCEPMYMKEKIKNPKCKYQTKAITCVKGQIEGCRPGSWLAGYGELDIGSKTPLLVSYCCTDKAVKIEKCGKKKKLVADLGKDGEQSLESDQVYQGQQCTIKGRKKGPIKDIIFKQEVCSYSVGGEKAPKGKTEEKGGKGNEKQKEGKEKGYVKEYGPCKKDADCTGGTVCLTNSQRKGSCVCRYGKKCEKARRKRFTREDGCNCSCPLEINCAAGQILVPVRKHRVEILGSSTNLRRRLCMCECPICR